MPERLTMSAADSADPVAHATASLLAACGLPRAWRGTDAWTVLDLDFGRGAAFLATLRAWRDDPARPARLHYAALLGAPCPRTALHAAPSSDAAGADDARALRDRWPIAVTGVHRIAFASGQVLLTLAVGPPATMLPGRVPHADALFIPLRGGSLGAPVPAVLRAACAMLADGARAAIAPLAPGDAGHAAIGTTARVLTDAGFSVSALAQEAAGASPARPSATGTLCAVRIRGAAASRRPAAARPREAIVVGAGLAGCAAAFALARRGWSVHRLGDIPMGAIDGSGQPMLAFHPSVTPDDAPLSRLTRNALLLARGAYDTGAARFVGRLQLDEPTHARAAAAGLPVEWVEAVDAARGSLLAGVRVGSDGLWLPLAGSADPQALREGWTIAGVQRRAGVGVARLEAIPGGWRARDADGAALAEAPIAILATGARDLMLQARNTGAPTSLWSHFGSAGLHARTARTTIAEAPRGALPGCVLGGDGHAVPLSDGGLLLGPADAATDPDRGESETAWRRFAAQLTDGALLPAPRLAAGPAGTRLSTRDHLPLAGPVPDLHALAALHACLRRDDRLPLPVLPGLFVAGVFGGRGLLWSVLAAELLAAGLEAEPAPLERALASALDPGRFLRRALRRSHIAV